MNQKVTVNESTVRSWIKKTLNEFGTVPAQTSAPIEPVRKEVADSTAPIILPSYRGNAEKRPGPRSTKSTRSEAGMAPEDLQKISSGLRDKQNEIGGKVWTQEDLYVPEHRGLGVSGVRKELETASDKLQLSAAVPELVLQMLEQAVKDYKQLLREPLKIINIALKEYTSDLVSSGELTLLEVKELKSAIGQQTLATSRGFNEFFYDWIENSAPSNIKKAYGRSDKLWFESIFTIARCGTLNIDDRTKASHSLNEDFIMESKHVYTPTVVDRALILRDPGFRYYVGGLGGKHVYYWDAVRNAAEKAGKYTGQF